ncbi:hypothetical protein CCYS_03355 [Corynebacterium cystitidis DSM 20524]|nr:hypothetical protein CCYS_03355 [Corynebacterium cystitidis DSM 20524]SNV85451.1 methionine import ATP-binding protein [Corynebacterium cystitidis]
MASTGTRIEFRNITKVFDGGVRALDGVTLTVEPGESWA